MKDFILMVFYPLTGDIFTTFSVTLLFQVGIHRLKEEFTRFEFYGRTSGGSLPEYLF